MKDKTSNVTTERQREARRENGHNRGGPSTDAGKERSSANAVKHGYWARKIQVIDRGPLREDPAELQEFIEAVCHDLNPEDRFLLRQSALDVADKGWRLTRVQRWEAYGYSAPGSATPLSEKAEWLCFLAQEDRKAADILRRLPDPAMTAEELFGGLCKLGFLLDVSEESLEELDEEDAPALLEWLTALIEDNLPSAEDAARILDDRADEREDEARGHREAERPGVVRQELDGTFSANADRLVERAGREYDRSLKRYWLLRETLERQPCQQTVDPGQAEQPVEEQSPPDRNEPSDEPDAEHGQVQGSSDARSDNPFEALLHELLEPELQ